MTKQSKYLKEELKFVRLIVTEMLILFGFDRKNLHQKRQQNRTSWKTWNDISNRYSKIGKDRQIHQDPVPLRFIPDPSQFIRLRIHPMEDQTNMPDRYQFYNMF